MPHLTVWRRLVTSLAVVAVGVALLTMTITREVLAASAVTIWPINPVIENNARAAALWLENHGGDTVTLQIRVLGWHQVDFGDQYADEQQEVIGSPPIATIAPGRRQLVRLTKTGETAANREMSYRVLIDEVPVPDDEDASRNANGGQATIGVRFRMRYSIPLFVYGAGLKSLASGGDRSHDVLNWRIVNDGDRRFLQVRNNGRLHARLTDVRMKTAREQVVIGNGLLGYVLPGAEMRWSLTEQPVPSRDSVIEAAVNGAPLVLQPY